MPVTFLFSDFPSPKHRQKHGLLEDDFRLIACSGWKITADHQTKHVNDVQKMVAKCRYEGSRGIFLHL